MNTFMSRISLILVVAVSLQWVKEQICESVPDFPLFVLGSCYSRCRASTLQAQQYNLLINVKYKRMMV